MDETQRWNLTVDGVHHRVEVAGTFPRTIWWYVGDDLVATTKTSDDKVQLVPDLSLDADRFWALGLRFTSVGRAKRVTLFDGTTSADARKKALLRAGGIDLDPQPGSWAARREERIRRHPGRYAAVAAAGGVAKVVVPLLLGLLAVRFVVNLPWPSWDIPWPQISLPAMPWPQIPWPQIDLPEWQVPAWLRWTLDHLRYVWPVVVTVVLARGEIARRRRQDALKAEMRGESVEATTTTQNASPATQDSTV